MKIEDIEQRFEQVAGLNMNLAQFPIKQTDYQKQNITTDKDKKNKFGEVFTPIFLVDQMIELDNVNPNKKYMDLCAGYGQFSVRLLRALTNKYKEFDLEQFIKEKLFFIQIQKESQQKLKYIFGQNINLYCGDVFDLKYSEETDRGILHFNGKKWIK